MHDISEAHVISHKSYDLLRLFVREVQAGEDARGDAKADLDVAVEANAVVWTIGDRGAPGCGLADVVKERAPCEFGRGVGGQLFKKKHGVDPDIAFRVVLGRLLDAVEL